MYRIKQFYIEQFEQRKTIMCTQHPIEEPCKLDPPWEGPQVIPVSAMVHSSCLIQTVGKWNRPAHVNTDVHTFPLSTKRTHY